MTTPKPNYDQFTREEPIRALKQRDSLLKTNEDLLKLLHEQQADRKQIQVFWHGEGEIAAKQK